MYKIKLVTYSMEGDTSVLTYLSQNSPDEKIMSWKIIYK
jgi:hypothetical protein